MLSVEFVPDTLSVRDTKVKVHVSSDIGIKVSPKLYTLLSINYDSKRSSIL